MSHNTLRREVNGTASAYAQGAASIARDVEEPSVVSGSGHWRVGGRYDGVADLFESAPTNMDMAFVGIVHLAPEQVSHMDAVLQRTTGMPVHQVTSTVSIEKTHLRDRTGHAARDVRRLPSLPQSGPVGDAPFTIDYFFRMLADITLAQTPDDAEHADAAARDCHGARRYRAAGG
ncbi:chemotaxis protein CheB [Burkholderia orbicola]|uniref:chemotaxis protein CheB n=1 Tax=Burkholderia orbicola TaxID=2978683 RepID=UPI0026548843|nr:chemotaxis protein CheB [Burkholderia orbicola]MDN7585197.1 chemotaxis protein CheB [Burkholderia orbicola]